MKASGGFFRARCAHEHEHALILFPYCLYNIVRLSFGWTFVCPYWRDIESNEQKGAHFEMEEKSTVSLVWMIWETHCAHACVSECVQMKQTEHRTTKMNNIEMKMKTLAKIGVWNRKKRWQNAFDERERELEKKTIKKQRTNRAKARNKRNQ